MWKSKCLCKVLILVIFTCDILGFKISKPLSRERIYIDVLKNITNINNILSDLLSNYEHLKIVYEEKAKPENILSGEIQANDDHEKKTTKRDYDRDYEYRPVTQMILFDENFSEERSDNSNEQDDIRENKQPQLSNPIVDLGNAKKIENKEGIVSNKSVIDLTRAFDVFKNKSPSKELSTNLSNKDELIIIGTALRYADNMPNAGSKEDKKIDSDLRSESKEDLNSNKPILRTSNDRDKLKSNKYRYRGFKEFEDFLVNGLKKDSKIPHSNKTILVFVVKKAQKDKNNRFESGSEELLNKDRLKSKILRGTYMSACIKHSIRRCYKTLRDIRKIICLDFNCKRSFKRRFKSNSKEGCKKAFHYRSDPGNKTKLYKWRGIYKKKKMKRNDKINTTTTRSTINSEEPCPPGMMSEETSDENLKKRKGRTQVLNETEAASMLRKRYETECKRVTSKKCGEACKYAVTKTCEAIVCPRVEKKLYKRTCRRECRQTYGRYGSDSDEDMYDDSYSYSDDSD